MRIGQIHRGLAENVGNTMAIAMIQALTRFDHQPLRLQVHQMHHEPGQTVISCLDLDPVPDEDRRTDAVAPHHCGKNLPAPLVRLLGEVPSPLAG